MEKKRKTKIQKWDEVGGAVETEIEGLGDSFDEQEVTIRVAIHNKISEKEFEYYVSYDIKDEKIISTCCINQKSLNKEELDLAHTFIDLLNQEIIKTAKFMLEIY